MRTNWIHLAIASGICAAANGLFAKLTTTSLTSTISHALAKALGLGLEDGGGAVKALEMFVRIVGPTLYPSASANCELGVNGWFGAGVFRVESGVQRHRMALSTGPYLPMN